MHSETHSHQPAKPLFSLGRVLMTPTAQAALEQRGTPALVQTMLNRHVLGDWGDVCAEDSANNDQALQNGERLLSVYRVDDQLTLWVVTEWDRSHTTILLPEDY